MPAQRDGNLDEDGRAWTTRELVMSLFEETIDATLDANGQLQLSSQPQLPAGPVRVTIFDGGHSGDVPTALKWLAAQTRTSSPLSTTPATN